MDLDISLHVVLDILPVSTTLRRPILGLPLEFCVADEPVVVLKVLGVAGLVERNEQENMAGPFHEPGIPNRGRELKAEELGNLFARVALPEFQLIPAPAQRAEMPFPSFQLQRSSVPRPWGARIGAEPPAHDAR